MTSEGVGNAAKIDGRMDSDLYLHILKDELLNSLMHYVLNPPDIIFQQDNCKGVHSLMPDLGCLIDGGGFVL